MRLVLIGEQEVNGRWVEHDRTELAQFSPLDGDAVHRMVERVREQYSSTTRRSRTSARNLTTHRPRRRRAPPPPYSSVYSPATPDYPPPTAPAEEVEVVQSLVIVERSPTPPPPFAIELEPVPLEDEPLVETPRSPSPEIPTSPRASPSQMVPGSPPTIPLHPVAGRPSTPARRRQPTARANITLAGATPPARPEHAPLATHPPPDHPRTIRPRWARRVRHLWSECHVCLEQRVHSALECRGCGQRPVCCECVPTLESISLTRGRCPVCRHTGDPEPWY